VDQLGRCGQGTAKQLPAATGEVVLGLDDERAAGDLPGDGEMVKRPSSVK
jgi:hypothetical protein